VSFSDAAKSAENDLPSYGHGRATGTSVSRMTG